MAKKNPKPPLEDDDDDAPRVGDRTEYDFSLNKKDLEQAASDSGTDFDLLKPAERAIGGDPDELDDSPRVGDLTEATYAEIDLGEVPTASASASSSNLFGTGIPAATAADSQANLEPLTPVQPASGWFDSVDEVQEIPPVATDAIEAALAEPMTGAIDDASDIFAGPVPPAQPKSDVSDVIAATAYRAAKPVEGEKPKPSSRASDVALNFDRPPGGSTVESLSASADVPMAKDAADSLFDDEAADSSKFAKTMPLEDAPDFGASPAGGIDASSILADLSEPGSAPGDSSAIRLESPGVEGTVHPAKFTRESTELDMDLPDAELGDATDWRQQGGSDLFGATQPEFELTPEMGKVDPFGDELDVDQPSLSSAPSSIFSGTKPPATGNSSVPVANPDSTADAVEFSEHPDPNAADSGSFHVLPAGAAGAVDFDMPESDVPHAERTMMAAIPEDDDDWAGAKTDPGPASSAILGRRKGYDPTDEMAPLPATPVKGKPEKKADAARVVAWADDATEEEKPRPKRREPKQPEPTNKRGLAGLALGLLLGVGASAGAYFSGVLPNKEGGDSKGTAVVQVDPQLQSKLDSATAELAAMRDRTTKAEKDAAEAQGRISKLDADAKLAMTAATEAEKKLAAQVTVANNFKMMADTLAAEVKTEKEKAVAAEKLADAEKAKTLKAEKDLLAEKDKTVKAEKDLTTEKDKVVALEKAVTTEKDKTLKVEKDLKAMLDKTLTDSTKAIDAAKAEALKAAEAAKAKQATVVAIAKELQAGKLLGEKFDDAALLAAAKSSVSRATGPDLSKLVPSELSSVAGTGLSTGHILDLASRTNKADAAVKAAAMELKKQADAYAKATTDLKDTHAVELKKQADASNLAMDKLKVDLKTAKDGVAVEVKKATDAANLAMDKLKVELKTAKDGIAAEVKKATDGANAAMDKLKADHAAKLKETADAHAANLKSLENAVALEKAKTAEAERKMKLAGGGTSLAIQELDRQSALSAARNLDLGIAEYKAGRYASAATALEEAAKFDPNDAVAWYYLGATRWAQGKTDDAKAAFKQGADREQLRLMTTKQIDGMIGLIQGPARDALGAARP
jgi:tetratricopeptide (TPR) repeat protein